MSTSRSEVQHWVPSSNEVNGFLRSWNTRKILTWIRNNVPQISFLSFRNGLGRILLASCREKDGAGVLQELLPLSIRHYNSIDHLYVYKVQTERNGPEVIHSFYPFRPCPDWSAFHALGGDPDEENFVPSVELQGTLLHIAAKEGNMKAVKILVEHGAKIDSVNSSGRTPLMSGVHNVEVAKFLIANGSNVNHQDNWGQTMLMLLAWKAKTCKALLKPLLAAGADPKIIDSYGKTMVHYACDTAIDGDVIPFVIENDLFHNIEENGVVSYAGRPLVINHGFQHFYKRKQEFSPIFLSHVKFCELLSCVGVKEYRKTLPVVHKFNQEVGVSQPSAGDFVAHPEYENRKEITTVAELDEIVGASSEPLIELYYQRLIICDRLIGRDSQESIALLHNAIWYQENNVNKAQLLCHLLERVISRYQKYNCTSSILESLGYYVDLEFLNIAEIFDKKHHNLLIEFLSKLADVTKLISGKMKGVHLHRYCHTPKCDLGVVFFGTLYMDLKNCFFTSHAVHLVLHLISEVIKNNLQLDEALLCKAIASCETYYHTPVFERDHILVQPSSILFPLLVHPDDDPHVISICRKVCELSAMDLVNYPVPDRQTLMHIAVKNNSVQLVEFLLEHGAHPDAVDSKGQSPSMLLDSSEDSACIRSKLVPDRLFCIASKVIVAEGFPYRKLGLSENVVKAISFHDKERYFS